MHDHQGQKRTVRNAFDRAAPSYDAAAAVQREACARLCAFADANPIEREVGRVMDAGSGTGYALPELLSRHPHALHVALDFSPAMLRIARGHSPFADPLCADIEQLPMAGASIDAIWSSLAVQWCTPVAVLSELNRVLTPGGMAWIATLGPRTLHELRASFSRIDDADHVISFFSTDDWHRITSASGLQLRAEASADIAAFAPDLRSLLRDLKSIGAHTVGDTRRRRPLGKNAWQALVADYEQWRRPDGRLPATYDLIMLALRKPG